METHYIKANFDNGDFIETKINGTKEEIKKYYVGNVFNLGTTKDNLCKCVSIEFLD